MTDRPIAEMVEFYLPLLVTAGDYALAIQPAVAKPSAHRNKDGHNPWVAAITDADLSVQNFLEVATLARYPEVRFFGEEHANSHNQKYFPRTAELSVHVDPINGTYLYRNGRPGWDIIVSIARLGRLVAAVSYIPTRGRYHAAIRGEGARTGDRARLRLAEAEPLRTGHGARTCLTYQAPDLKARLAGHIQCLDIVADDDPARGLDNLNELFTERLGAFACRDGECLDWGAAAFLATEAGGCASHLDGSPLRFFDQFDPEGRTDMLVSANREIHGEILGLIAG
jgi:fructose-1,6-bisphosphatase/inositol monophosphatase family enzyme